MFQCVFTSKWNGIPKAGLQTTAKHLQEKNLVLLESPVKPFCQAKGCPGSWCWKPSTAGSPLFLTCPGRSLAWGGQSFGFFTVWTFFTLGSTALQEPMGSSLCYSSTQSIKCTMSRPNSSADPPPSKEVHPSIFTAEASCKMRDSFSLPTDCLKVARGLAFASLSFSRKIYVETHIGDAYPCCGAPVDQNV